MRCCWAAFLFEEADRNNDKETKPCAVVNEARECLICVVHRGYFHNVMLRSGSKFDSDGLLLGEVFWYK